MTRTPSGPSRQFGAISPSEQAGQFSIVIGVVLAFAIYKEPGKAIRLAGTGLILAGLIVIGLWGR